MNALRNKDGSIRLFTMTEEEYLSHNENSEGLCLACGDIADGVEPDAEGYECGSCNKPKVMGFEQVLMEGLIDFVEAE